MYQTEIAMNRTTSRKKREASIASSLVLLTRVTARVMAYKEVSATIACLVIDRLLLCNVVAGRREGRECTQVDFEGRSKPISVKIG
jgi:hypothetical protein